MKYTTVALAKNQQIKIESYASVVEVYCKGFTDGKRDQKLDGYYFRSEVTIKA